MNIKLILFDFDGVFTDGKIYVNENNIKSKCYNCKDTYGLKLLQKKNIDTGIITADTTNILDNCYHIITRINHVSKGKFEKLNILEQWKEELKINYENIAYIGDDIPDICILEKVGFSACPSDAIDKVKNICNYICKNRGGDGCVREFIDVIIESINVE